MLKNLLANCKKVNIDKGLVYSQMWMRGQYIFAAENTNTDGNYHLTVSFKPVEFDNCRFQSKKANPQMKFKLKPKEVSNLVIIERIKFAANYSIGTFSFGTVI